jgi:CheY-like chemotaxis protein
MGLAVVEATDGLELLDAFGPTGTSRYGRPPDLVISDVQMAPCSGVRALCALREMGLPVPVILVSTLCDDDLRGRARALGATALLDKPFDLSELKAIVMRALEPSPLDPPVAAIAR